MPAAFASGAKTQDPLPAGLKEVLMYAGPNEMVGSAGQEHSQAGQDWLIASLLDCRRDG